MENDTFSSRLAVAMNASGKSQSEVATLLGVSRASVSQMMSGKIATPSSIVGLRLSDALSVNLEWLILGKGEMNDGVDSEFIVIPVFDVKSSCGYGVRNFDCSQSYKSLSVRKDWLRANCRFSDFKNLSIITAFGDSMRPTIEDGDLLLVDNSVNEFRGDAIYAVMVNGEIYTKRIQKKPSGQIIMKSDNTMYEPYEVSTSDDFIVLGKVVRRWSSSTI